MRLISPRKTLNSWVSGPITVEVAFDTSYFKLVTDFSRWTDAPDVGSAWTYRTAATAGNLTTLTFTHDEIAMSGNTMTGAFEFFLEVLKPVPVKAAPPPQTANGRTVTEMMQVTVTSSLGAVHRDYIQEDSRIIGVDPLP